MPDKEGSDDEKTTKGVVKKKQKQMMGEEGYDTYRDNILMRGGDHRSKETKEKSYTPSEQPKGQTAAQKAAKGKSALELVKASITKKYGKGAIMDVKKKSKKKANEELDLTKIAEAFGGYIIEANGKKKNGKKDETIPDPWSEKAKEQAKKDIEREPETMDIDTFQGRQKFKEPVTGTPKAKGFKPKPGSVKFTQRPGEAPVKITRDPSVIDPKFAKKKTPKPKVDVDDQQDYKKAAKSFKKDIGGEKIISPTMQDRLKKATEGPRKARKRRSDAASFAQVKADIDTADAARKAKKRGEYAADYEKRLGRAYDKSLEGTVKTGRSPAGQPLPATPLGIKGQPQKDRPRAQKPPEGVYGMKGTGQKEVIGKVDDRVTGGEYGKLRSGQTADQSAFVQAQTGRDLEGNPLSKDQRVKLMRRSRGLDSDAVKNVSKNLTKGGMPRSELDKSGGFDSGREGESITRRPPRQEVSPKSPNVKVNVNVNQKGQIPSPQQIGKTVTDKTTEFMRGQSKSTMGAMGGIIGKSAVPASAGYEAGVNLSRGDRFGAALSLGQSLGGATGFAFGVLNALRMRAPGYQVPKPRSPKFDPRTGGKLATKGQVSMDKETGEGEAMMGAGGAALSNVLRRVRQAQGLAQKGYQGRTGFISAQGGGGL